MVLDIIIKNIYELSIENIRDIISILIPFIALIVSICSFISTNKTSRLQREVLEKQKLPNLKIISVESFKSKYGSSDTVYDDKYCRMYYGENTVNISLDNNIAIFDLKKPEIYTQIEDGFIEEIKSHINQKHNAYFTYFGYKPYLILNHASNPNSFIVDHSNVKIKLHNYGTPITSISIKSGRVDIPLAGYAPHRTRRAAFPHRALCKTDYSTTILHTRLHRFSALLMDTPLACR